VKNPAAAARRLDEGTASNGRRDDG